MTEEEPMVRPAEIDQFLHLAEDWNYIPGKDEVRVDFAGDQDIEGCIRFHVSGVRLG